MGKNVTNRNQFIVLQLFLFSKKINRDFCWSGVVVDQELMF